MAYADTFRVITRLDVFTPDPRSRQVALRLSYKVDWLSKPFGIYRVMNPVVHDKVEKDFDKLPAWYEAGRMSYLAGLETGLYELPSEMPSWEWRSHAQNKSFRRLINKVWDYITSKPTLFTHTTRSNFNPDIFTDIDTIRVDTELFRRVYSAWSFSQHKCWLHLSHNLIS